LSITLKNLPLEKLTVALENDLGPADNRQRTRATECPDMTLNILDPNNLRENIIR
jgi:hypothetical protein